MRSTTLFYFRVYFDESFPGIRNVSMEVIFTFTRVFVFYFYGSTIFFHESFSLSWKFAEVYIYFRVSCFTFVKFGFTSM